MANPDIAPIGDAFQTAQTYGFYDGTTKMLAIRLLDFVLYKGLCSCIGLTLASPSSLMEVGSMTVGVVRVKDGVTNEFWLRECRIVLSLWVGTIRWFWWL